jgi:hypothetical protein
MFVKIRHTTLKTGMAADDAAVVAMYGLLAGQLWKC